MRKWALQFAAVLAFILTISSISSGQHTNVASNSMLPNPRSAQGSLTVTLTVVSSVGLVTGPDGQQRVVAANAATPSDNVSSLQYVRMTDAHATGTIASQSSANALRKTHRK